MNAADLRAVQHQLSDMALMHARHMLARVEHYKSLALKEDEQHSRDMNNRAQGAMRQMEEYVRRELSLPPAPSAHGPL